MRRLILLPLLLALSACGDCKQDLDGFNHYVGVFEREAKGKEI